MTTELTLFHSIRLARSARSLDPLRVHSHHDLTTLSFAADEYVDFKAADESGYDYPQLLTQTLLRSHYTKGLGGRRENFRDSSFFGNKMGAFVNSLWEGIDGAVLDSVLRNVEGWRDDLRIARDFRLHLGSRPRGSGGSMGKEEVESFLGEYAHSVSKNDEKKRGERKIDEADVVGGGFHMLLFEVLLDENYNPFVIDVDGFPHFEGGEDGGGDELYREELWNDVLRLAGWIAVEEQGQEGANANAKAKANANAMDGICGGEGDVGAGICRLRLGELDLEIANMVKTKFNQLLPSERMCNKAEELAKVKYFDKLDREQCAYFLNK